ncbi:MAG: glycosyltransferase family 39 protein [Candidatus Levybacteria bacterium]|nr:glycosyltransferase family 39 protein [Candidatus Levybacteria bacterium]
MKNIHIIILAGIIFFGFIFRLYRFDNPIAEWHSWRQVDTSSVSRVFVEEGFDLLHPKYHDLSNVPSGKNNPEGYRFVEFPIYNLLQGGLFKLVGLLSLEEWGRLITIFSSLSSLLFIYLILSKHQGRISGLIAAFFFGFLPFSIYYGRVVLPDTMTAAGVLGGIYFFDLWSSAEKERKSFKKTFPLLILATSFTALAFLLKPFAGFFTLPMFYLAFDRFGFKALIKWQLYFFLVLAILPVIGWRLWMLQYPEGIPWASWLLNLGDIRFKGAFFYWLFADRIGRLILGYWGIVIFAAGFLLKTKKPLFFYSFVISSLAYFTVIARGNVQHDYYQIMILPTIVIFMGLGGEFLLSKLRNIGSKFGGIIIFSISTVFCLMFGWYFVRDYFNINNGAIINAGLEVDRIIPKDAKIIANYGGDTTLLYQTKRKGWASLQGELWQMRDMGAGYLLMVNPTPADFEFAKGYKIVKATSEYALFDLNSKK